MLLVRFTGLLLVASKCCLIQDAFRKQWDALFGKFNHVFLFLLSLEQPINIWYRHTGQAEVEYIDPNAELTVVSNESNVKAAIGQHQITHLFVKGGNVPDLRALAPNVTNLRIEGGINPSELSRYAAMNL